MDPTFARKDEILMAPNEKGQKKGTEFLCPNCNFRCSDKYHWSRHLSTEKHKILTNPNKKGHEQPHLCLCGKRYKHSSTLCNHRKGCSVSLAADANISNYSIGDEPMLESKLDNTALIEIIKQNQEFKSLIIEQRDMLVEQNNKLIEMSKQPVIINQTNNQTNNFNLNFFLNEQCKNALNIQEFLDSMCLNVEDIEATGRLGYVNGISRILINKLKEIDIYSRPLHCTDYKRETIYIKNENNWEKEDSEKPTLKQIVKIVAKKNLRQLPEWQKENPDYKEVATAKNDEFVKISLSCLGASTPEEDEKDTNKILRNVLKEVVIDKSL
jgi:hypothetical protein